jgi:hypothetical protein
MVETMNNAESIQNENNEKLKKLEMQMSFLSSYMHLYYGQINCFTEKFIAHLDDNENQSNQMNKLGYADLIEAAEHYKGTVIDYKKILTDEIFLNAKKNSNESKFAFQCKYTLIAQIAQDVRRVNAHLETLSYYLEFSDEQDYLLQRWHAELMQFTDFRC